MSVSRQTPEQLDCLGKLPAGQVRATEAAIERLLFRLRERSTLPGQPFGCAQLQSDRLKPQLSIVGGHERRETLDDCQQIARRCGGKRFHLPLGIEQSAASRESHDIQRGRAQTKSPPTFGLFIVFGHSTGIREHRTEQTLGTIELRRLGQQQ